MMSSWFLRSLIEILFIQGQIQVELCQELEVIFQFFYKVLHAHQSLKYFTDLWWKQYL